MRPIIDDFSSDHQGQTPIILVAFSPACYRNATWIT
jgi:hypothetical protein